MVRLTSRVRFAVLSTLLIAGSLTPASAEAQLFKKLKDAAAAKAAERIGEKAVDKAAAKAGIESESSGNANEVALLGPALTSDTLDLVLKGLGAMTVALDERDKADEAHRAARDKASDLRSHPAVLQWQERDRLVSRCQDAFFDELQERQRAEFDKKRETEAAKYQAAAMKFAQEMAPLQAKNDIEGMKKKQLEFMRDVLGVDPAADTVAAKKKCGSKPAQPAQLAEAEKYEAIAKKQMVEVRSLEAAAEEKGAQASGLPARRFAQARERILTWISRGARKNGFGDHALLEQRRGDIDKMKRAL
jgi:hypothetical protein